MAAENKALTISEPAKSIIMLDEVHARVVVHNVETLTKSFKQWLKDNVDYTRTLFGQSGKPSLLDPGAQKIRSFFQAYPEIHILEHLEDRTPERERVKYVVRADITHVSGVRIGSGVGSCSTDESKYQYRWLTADKLRDLGYTEAQIGALPRREMSARRGGHFTVYRIRNPEILDLDNTILKMASKRAEVDATLSLPGVSGVFTQDIDQYPDALGAEDRKQVEVEAKPVEPQKKEEAIKQEPEKPKAQPKWDPDEQTVITTLEVHGLPVKDLSISKYGIGTKNVVVRVEPQEGFPQEMFKEYNEVLKLLKAKWLALENRWEVSKP